MASDRRSDSSSYWRSIMMRYEQTFVRERRQAWRGLPVC